ncbi:MAG: bifunctional metallophosphatase/5'-nucleotidase [bacterium]|nr:bifunctional metallophosphatase/5'-nucleotidase [bacterium]
MPKKNINILILILCFYCYFNTKLYSLPKNIRELTIYATSDIHGNLLSKKGGLLKLATLLKKEVNKSGGLNNCLIIDCGDTLHGSIEATLSKGELIQKILNYLHYDIFVPGNHDLEFGTKVLADRINNLNADSLAANLKFNNEYPGKLYNWKIYKRNGLKIAVIGLTFPFIDHWMYHTNNDFFEIKEVNKVLKNILPDVVKKSPDLIILAMHSGLHGSYKFDYKQGIKAIASNYPEIDIILGGHTHKLYSGDILNNNIYYVQPGSKAEYLSKITVKYNLKNHSKIINSQLLPVNISTVDLSLSKKLSPLIKNCKVKKLDQIAYIPKNKKINFNKLIAKIMGKITGSDAAIYNLSYSTKYLKGIVTYKTIYDSLKYEDSIILLRLSNKELNSIINEIIKYKKKKGEYKEFNTWGIPAKKNGRITLAVTSYYAAGARNKFPIIKKLAALKGVNSKIHLREAVINYLKKKYPVKNR